MKRREAREAEDRMNQERQLGGRFASTVVIAAAIIAAVRLAREENIRTPTPRLLSAISDSVSLARMLLDNVLRRFPQG